MFCPRCGDELEHVSDVESDPNRTVSFYIYRCPREDVCFEVAHEESDDSIALAELPMSDKEIG